MNEPEYYYLVLMFDKTPDGGHYVCMDDVAHETLEKAEREAALLARNHNADLLGIVKIHAATGIAETVYNRKQIQHAPEWETEE